MDENHNYFLQKYIYLFKFHYWLITDVESHKLLSLLVMQQKKKNIIFLYSSFYWGEGEKWAILDWFWCLIEVDGFFDSEVHHGVVMDCLPCGLLTEHAQTGRGLKHVQLLLQILNLLLMKISKINKDIIVSKYKISGPHDHKLKKILV